MQTNSNQTGVYWWLLVSGNIESIDFISDSKHHPKVKKKRTPLQECTKGVDAPLKSSS